MKKAFTMAEVLITLMIIGVIAMVTIPSLIASYKEKMFITRLKNTYSIVSNAYLRTMTENGPSDTWNASYGVNSSVGAKMIYDYFKPFMKIKKFCGTAQTGCFAQKYYPMKINGPSPYQVETDSIYTKAQLENGVSIAFYYNGNALCIGTITVDVNGPEAPNRWGEDTFEFYIKPDRIVPNTHKEWCNYNSTHANNGKGCSLWVLSHGNLDYLHRDVSAEW